MRLVPRRLMSGQQMQRRASELSLLAVLAVALELAAGTGLAYLAGFSNVRAVLGRFDWPWLTALVGGLIISFAGYYFAYRGIFRVLNGPRLPWRQMLAVVAAGFGGFIALGGGALDQYALEAAGADKDEAKARAVGLAGLEHGVLAIGGTAAAIAVLMLGRRLPPPSFTLPWAVIPIPGSPRVLAGGAIPGPVPATSRAGAATSARSLTRSISSGSCSCGRSAGGRP